ncbi:MAG: helix-turn-helix transcriptional regulator, partial [Caldilineaceae bacterium]
VSRIFLRELGLSPWDYLTRVRMEHARTLLLAPESGSVAEIALRVGYTDPAYFARTFRHYTGRSPQAFRQSSDAPNGP